MRYFASCSMERFETLDGGLVFFGWLSGPRFGDIVLIPDTDTDMKKRPMYILHWYVIYHL